MTLYYERRTYYFVQQVNVSDEFAASMSIIWLVVYVL